MKVAVIDNYDSFVYNLVHYLEAFNCKVSVYRNNAFALDTLKSYSHILLSPGPGLPNEAGLLKEVIKTYKHTHKILGVCLGHQAIAEVFGGNLINLTKVYHGVASTINISQPNFLFDGIGSKMEVGRYHSWVVNTEGFPPELEITATDKHQQIMALQHRKYAIQGVQFHPESILTPQGKTLIKNWISL